MTIFTEQEAKTLLDKVIKLSKADECTATLEGAIDGNVRFARNSVSTSGIVSNCDLAVQVAFGKRVGTATINKFDDASLERVVRRAEELARLAPENPEFMPAIGKQAYKPTSTFVQATADITPVAIPTKGVVMPTDDVPRRRPDREWQQLADEAGSLHDKLLMVISDVEMPDMDGYRLTTEIRQDARLAGLFVLLHSSLSGTFNQAMVKRVGADQFIPKLNADELAQGILARLELPQAA